MKTVVIYIAEDGKQFNDEQACVAYECAINQKREKINEAIATLREYCDNTTCGNCFACNHFTGECSFRENDPSEWDDMD